jgi:alginate O-acetyltransferase complex protein AlgI
MIFTEWRFFPFFVLVFLVHWALPRERWRRVWLLVASYAFYGAWDWRFLGLIWLSTVMDYLFAWKLARVERRRRVWMWASVVLNLGILGAFKYCNFFVDSGALFLRFLGIDLHPTLLAIVLPAGISFYTFQSMSYTLDVYRRELAPARNLLDFAFFVAFFPQLVAGPIMRAADFLPQLEQERDLSRVDFRACLVLFLAGFAKKACVSDNLAPLVEHYFAAPELFGSASAWLATLSYATQIYCDFSGYSDMAIACAGLLGYRLCLNFDFPYFAQSITEFWRRWHMSLSSWLRDYLYIPLGGSRGSRAFVFRNLMLTMLLGGLWHGAAWNFVAWGALHGLALCVHRVWTARVPGRSVPRRALAALGLPLTFVFVCLCWIFFRAEDLATAWGVTRVLLFLGPGGPQQLELLVFLPLAALALAHLVVWRRWLAGWWTRPPAWGFAVAYGVLVGLCLPFVSIDFTPFIYFQF